MDRLNIEWSSDDHDCETCGYSYSEGAVVKYNGKIILNKPACASCTDTVNVDYEDVLIALSEHLKISIKENN